MENQLVKIPIVDLPKLRDLFKVDWPKHIVVYYTVANYIQWFEKCPNISNVKIYSLNGDWSDGTVLIIDNFELYINSLDDTKERLKIAINLLDWSKGYRVNCFSIANRPALMNVIQLRQLQTEMDNMCNAFRFPFNEALKLDIQTPPGITLKPLTEIHAEKINDLWTFQYPGSITYIRRLIEMNPSIGAYTNDGQLIAWCLILPSKALGILQVLENYYRQGLATLVLKALIKQLAEDGIEAFAYVHVKNIPSTNMFTKIGFQIIEQVYYYQTTPLHP